MTQCNITHFFKTNQGVKPKNITESYDEKQLAPQSKAQRRQELQSKHWRGPILKIMEDESIEDYYVYTDGACSKNVPMLLLSSVCTIGCI